MIPDQYPPAAISFKVVFGSAQLVSETSFQEVSGIGSEMETDPYHEGGENRFVYALPKGVRHQKLTLKRGVASYASPLVKWCRDTLENGLGAPISPQPLVVYLQDELGAPLRGWSFENAWPAQWSIDQFRADRNEVAIEKIELNYAVSSRKL
jgi:phage tail-like protein